MTDAGDVRRKLEQSVGPVLYSDLAAPLRRNGVFYVEPELALVDAALAIATDDAGTVRRHLATGALRRPSEEEQRIWASAADRKWNALIVQPFVLVADPLD